MSDGAMLPSQRIGKKLVAILAEVANVEKKGRNKAQQYDFVRETDLVDKVRPIMAKSGLFLNLSVTGHELIEMGKTQSGSTMRLTVLTINGTWVDADSGDIWPLPVTFVGYGADTGDKGVYKAMTGAEKYLLFKSFLVGTGDDPEADERVDRNPAGRRAGGAQVQAGTPATDVARGGRAGTATVAQLRRIASLLSETGLTPDGFRRLVTRETGLTAPDGAMNRWLADQPAGLVGKIIGTLSALADAETESDEGTTPSDNAMREQEGSGSGYNDSDDLPLV